jgi:hypothetical protein|tara:strand:+ start:39287 stop:39472 length:186 start_codon:yes stop_codon:yes gene_type:complete
VTDYKEGTFALPDERPLTEGEWAWVNMMRSVNGGRLPKLTLNASQEFQVFIRKVWPERMSM